MRQWWCFPHKAHSWKRLQQLLEQRTRLSVCCACHLRPQVPDWSESTTMKQQPKILSCKENLTLLVPPSFIFSWKSMASFLSLPNPIRGIAQPAHLRTKGVLEGCWRAHSLPKSRGTEQHIIPRGCLYRCFKQGRHCFFFWAPASIAVIGLRTTNILTLLLVGWVFSLMERSVGLG